MPQFDIEVDVLVIGAGGAGLAAAVAAHDAGAQVAVVEKQERAGGNTALSTASLPGAGTRFQKRAGIEDTPQTMLDDFRRLAGEHDASALARLLCERSAELVEWLADTVGVPLDVITDYKHVGHSVPRLHAPASRKGEDLVRCMVAALESRGIPLALANPAMELEFDDAGRVAGAATLTRQGERARIGAARTILAVNGFGAAPDMVREYCPEIAGAMYVGAPGSQGEALRWGRALNARLGNMASYQGYATVITPHGELLSWTNIEKGGIVVNAQGRRFGDESIGYSGFAAPVLAQAGPTYAVFDQRIRDVSAQEPWFKELLDYGGAKRAEDAAALARALGVDPAALADTLERYGAAARGERADEHGRRDFGLAPLRAPYWYSQVQPALLSTQGGLMVDAQGRVLDASDAPIPNLYAAGGAVASLAGRSGGVGYLSGSGLLHAIGLGWIAGQSAAREMKGSPLRADARPPGGGAGGPAKPAPRHPGSSSTRFIRGG